MKHLLYTFFLLSFFSAEAQFGLNLKYNTDDYSEFSEGSLSNAYSTSYEIGVNYWLRLKNKRVEFYPEIAYSLGVEETFELPGAFVNSAVNVWSLNLNTRIYPFDFNGDCDCPTWSKQGDFLQKGFFISINPFLDYDTFNSDIEAFESSVKTSLVSYGIGLGVGTDIGVNDLLTISPFFQFNYTPSYSGEAFTDIAELACPTCDVIRIEDGNKTQLQFGIRLGFRPDYK